MAESVCSLDGEVLEPLGHLVTLNMPGTKAKMAQCPDTQFPSLCSALLGDGGKGRVLYHHRGPWAATAPALTLLQPLCLAFSMEGRASCLFLIGRPRIALGDLGREGTRQ